MNTDRELLELAAKAAGLNITWKLIPTSTHEAAVLGGGSYMPFFWNPLTDDGDALRLAVVLGIPLNFDHSCGAVTATDPWTGKEFFGAGTAHGKGDPAVTRRAIVRAAAEIGRAMS